MGSQIARLAKNVLIYGLGGGLNQALQFLLLPFFTAYLSPRDYGIVGILAFISFIVSPVFALGLGAALGVCYYDSEDPGQRQATIATAFGLLLFSAGMLSIIAFLGRERISLLAFQSARESHLLVYSLLTTSLLILTQPWQTYLQFEEKALALQVLNVFATLVSIGMDVLLIIVLRKGVTGWVISSFIGQALTLLLFLTVTLPRFRFRFSAERGRELLRLGLPTVPSSAGVFVLLQGNRYLLERVIPGSAGLALVGLYTLGTTLSSVMNLAVSAFQNAWVPYFMSYVNRWEEARVLFGRVMTYYVFGFGTLSLLFYIAARPVVLIMTKTPFHAAYPIIGLAASAQMLMGVFSLLMPGTYFAREIRYASPLQLLAAGISVVSSVWLIAHFRLFGAGVGLVLGILAMDVIVYLWNRLRRGYLRVDYQWGRIGRFAVLYFAYVAVFLCHRTLSLSGEILLSCAGASLLLPFLYLLTTYDERQALYLRWERLRRRSRTGGPVQTTVSMSEPPVGGS